jgi:hypothetical protein
MKTLLFCLVGLALVSGCNTRGRASLEIEGNEPNLPAELRGIRVWNLDVGHGERVRISILNSSVSTTYYTKEGVITSTVERDVLWENDSLMLVRK